MIRLGVSVGVDEAGVVVEDFDGARSGGSLVSKSQCLLNDSFDQGLSHGRKLHEEEGRLATRVKISEIRRCCTAVSLIKVSVYSV